MHHIRAHALILSLPFSSSGCRLRLLPEGIANECKVNSNSRSQKSRVSEFDSYAVYGHVTWGICPFHNNHCSSQAQHNLGGHAHTDPARQ